MGPRRRNGAACYAAIKLPRDPKTGRYRQDDTFHLLEPVEPAALKDGDQASYHKVCFDRVQRYRVIKQADRSRYNPAARAFYRRGKAGRLGEDFEPLCLHDSTLSFATHALFAFQNGLAEQGEAYLEKALFLVLRDVMGNTGKEGLHLACMGEAWQAAMLWSGSGTRRKPGRGSTCPRLKTGRPPAAGLACGRGRLPVSTHFYCGVFLKQPVRASAFGRGIELGLTAAKVPEIQVGLDELEGPRQSAGNARFRVRAKRMTCNTSGSSTRRMMLS